MGELFCPKCDYNLTGLTEARCPECGSPFDPSEITNLVAKAPKPIRPGSVIFHLTWPAVGVFFLAFLIRILNFEWLYGTLVICVLVYSLVNSVELAGRISTTMNVHKGGSTYARPLMGRHVSMVVFFLVVQLVLAGAGLGAGFWVALLAERARP